MKKDKSGIISLFLALVMIIAIIPLGVYAESEIIFEDDFSTYPNNTFSTSHKSWATRMATAGATTFPDVTTGFDIVDSSTAPSTASEVFSSMSSKALRINTAGADGSTQSASRLYKRLDSDINGNIKISFKYNAARKASDDSDVRVYFRLVNSTWAETEILRFHSDGNIQCQPVRGFNGIGSWKNEWYDVQLIFNMKSDNKTDIRIVIKDAGGNVVSDTAGYSGEEAEAFLNKDLYGNGRVADIRGITVEAWGGKENGSSSNTYITDFKIETEQSSAPTPTPTPGVIPEISEPDAWETYVYDDFSGYKDNLFNNDVWDTIPGKEPFSIVTGSDVPADMGEYALKYVCPSGDGQTGKTISIKKGFANPITGKVRLSYRTNVVRGDGESPLRYYVNLTNSADVTVTLVRFHSDGNIYVPQITGWGAIGNWTTATYDVLCELELFKNGTSNVRIEIKDVATGTVVADTAKRTNATDFIGTNKLYGANALNDVKSFTIEQMGDKAVGGSGITVSYITNVKFEAATKFALNSYPNNLAANIPVNTTEILLKLSSDVSNDMKGVFNLKCNGKPVGFDWQRIDSKNVKITVNSDKLSYNSMYQLEIAKLKNVAGKEISQNITFYTEAEDYGVFSATLKDGAGKDIYDFNNLSGTVNIELVLNNPETANSFIEYYIVFNRVEGDSMKTEKIEKQRIENPGSGQQINISKSFSNLPSGKYKVQIFSVDPISSNLVGRVLTFE